MPTISTATTSGTIRQSSANFTTARDGSGTEFLDLSDTDDIIDCRKRVSTFFVNRAFYAFDTSSITTAVISATLDVNVNGLFGGSTTGILVKGTKPDLSTNLAASDFTSTQGCTAAQSGASYVSTATAYSSAFAVSGTGALSITFNSTALNDMLTNGVFNLVIFNESNDFTNNEPNSANRFDIDGRTGTTPLVLNYTLAEVASINGAAIGNISKILGTAKANIASINEVDLP
tara:strand:+ start:1209 stop:1904 length:696 start_codon:yes stop_codon:yes gene_type:complete